ncbi:tetratricopeptide repeat-containing sensor histidine kinase [Pedobacter rhodius]|uniref:histidine kinase n=1 Tax=Pedobacter rhodius TaxID=3004098 RepID=A0ABT4KWM7_9SPHI|nr:sensor histidine kinase [Pedobacter sp. SJ11]MCZ4223342.1 sensor histidine kinase [Pedobacter sp. SJ11]
MMKLILCSVFFFVVFKNEIHAQRKADTKYRDSLALTLKSDVSNAAKAKICFLLADDWAYTDSIKAKSFLNQGKNYGKGDKFIETLAIYYSARLLASNNPVLATRMYMLAEQKLAPYHTTEAFIARSKCWHDYSKLLHHEKDDAESYINILLNKSIPLAIKANDSTYIGKNYLDVAIGFKNLTEFKKAKYYLIKAVDILEKTKGSVEYLASAYHTLSENYSLSGESQNAALMLERMRKILTPYPDSELWLDYYAGEAMRLTIAEQFDKSLSVANKGIALAQKLKEVYPEQRLLLQKFYALYNKKDFSQAKDVAIDLTKRKPFMNISVNRIQIFYALAKTFEELKDSDGAYEWLEKYSKLNDSLAKSNLETKVNALEIRFRNAESRKKIAALNAANEKANLDAKNSRLINWLLGSISLFMFIVFALTFFFYQNRKKLEAQKEQVRVSRAMLLGQENERVRLARDLHDGLGGMLASIKINLSDFASEKKISDADLNQIIKRLDSSIKELRRIAHNMMPEMLLKFGLESSLRDLCASLISETLQINFQCLGISPNLIIQEQIAIYRIVQELLSNVVKHSNAKNALLQCSQDDQVFFITIEDDGKGFNPDGLAEQPGIGLNNIKSRVAYLNGTLEILSKDSQPGTSINIELHVKS